MSDLSSELETALLALIASVLVVSIGWKKGFFRAPGELEKPRSPPTLLLVLGAFAIYFLMGLIIPLLFHNFLSSSSSMDDRIGRMSWATFLISAFIFGALALYFALVPKAIRQGILLRKALFEPKKDLAFAIYAWLIAFPVVLLLSSALELLSYLIFGTFELPDQNAILFKKMTFSKPLYFTLATLSVVVFAPLIEETLFRGFLQSYLRRYLSPAFSIAIASLGFTSFHFSADQGFGNFPILGSLFLLGCFLGFLYERQQSLFAPILLHAVFNALSIANLYFLSAA
jgi:membrane protease YdiL (CAAX protease family)